MAGAGGIPDRSERQDGAGAPGERDRCDGGTGASEVAAPRGARRLWALRLVLTAVAVAGIAAAVTLVLTAALGSGASVRAVPAPDVTLDQLLDAPLASGVELAYERPSGPLVARIDEAAAPARLLTVAGDVLRALLLAGGAVLLAAIVALVGRGRPFAPQVSRWTGMLAGLLVVASVVPASFDNLAAVVVLGSAGVDLIGGVLAMQVLELELGPLLVAATLLAVDQAVRHGRRLETEVEGLV